MCKINDPKHSRLFMIFSGDIYLDVIMYSNISVETKFHYLSEHASRYIIRV